MDPAFLLSDEAFARRIAIGLLRDREGAEDLVQEAWLEILARPPKHDSGLRAYLAIVLRRLSHRRRNAEAARTERERAVARAEAQDDHSALVARAEIHHRTVAAVVALHEPYRSTVLLRFFEGLSPEEIAARERIPAQTVRTRLKRAIALLRERLERDGLDWRRDWVVALTGGGWPETALARSSERAKFPRWSAAALTTVVLTGIVLVLHDSADRRSVRAIDEESVATATTRSSSPNDAIALPGTEPNAREPEPLELRSTPASFLAGRVTDESGRPLRGVRLILALSAYSKDSVLDVVESDSDGRFALALDEWSARSACSRALFGLLVEAWFPGRTFLTHSVELGPDFMPAALALVLPPGRTLSGRAVDEAGAPVASAVIQVYDTASRLHADTAIVDREGHFAMALEPGAHVVEVLGAHPGRGYVHRSDAELPDDTSGNIDLGTLVFQRGRVLSGRCIHPDGTPVRALGLTTQLVEPGLDGRFDPVDETRVEFTDGVPRAFAVTDELGRFETCGLRSGLFQLMARGTALGDGAAWSAGETDIEVVDPHHTLAIEVVAPDGRALEEARVAFTRLTEAGEPAGDTVRTLATGPSALATANVEPGEVLAVLVVVPGCAQREERVEIPSLPYETSLRMELVADDRRATVILRPSEGGADAWRIDLCAPFSGAPLPGLQDLAPDGEGRVRGLPLGRYRIRVEPRLADEHDGVPATCTVSALPVTLGAAEHPLDFVARPAARVRVLFTEGDVRPATLTPIDLAKLEGAGAGLFDWLTLMPSRASIELRSLDAGEPLLRRVAGLHPRAGRFVDLVAPAGPLRLRLQLDAGPPSEFELSPAPGETLEISIDLSKAAKR